MEQYLMTISCQQKTKIITESHILDVIMWLKMNISSLKIIDYEYETSGKYEQLHFHGIISVKSGFKYKPFTKYGDHTIMPSFSINYKQITYLFGAYKYIHKDSLQTLFSNNLYKK